MDTNHLKQYAPKARRAFIDAVTRRAARFGITEKEITPVEEKGELYLIGGEVFSRKVAGQRRKLEQRVRQQGFQQAMEAIAYTWFNRLAAIRYMELHGYLNSGYRVLSHPEGKPLPEILEQAEHIDLPGLDRERVIELKLDGTKDEALYRDLLLAQCHALHQAMPFLFEAIDDETELLLPDNLLQTDSLIRDLVTAIPEAAWQQVEIIGWLYQFYISEKKDQVIGKVVKSEDIPAATQLFTPNWIVKYMVQNSLGAQWLATYPDSSIRAQMEYYIEPAEQTAEVGADLAAITPDSLDPEALTLIDPACGSGHILTEAYELFKTIYLERGYRQRDVPKLILEKNLFGLDIDGRAAQLTGFALMMKGRADDRRLFGRGVKLKVMALVDSGDFDAERLAEGVNLANYGLRTCDLTELKRLFEHATTFGSLIQVPEGLAAKLPTLKELSERGSQDLFVADELKRLGVLVRQAEMLAGRYDAVVANPPYMGSKYQPTALKRFVIATYKAGKTDLYGAFTLRNIQLAKMGGHVSMITIPNWMFISSFEEFRNTIFQTAPFSSLVHIGRGVWGSDYGSCSYVLKRSAHPELSGCFLRLFDRQGKIASNEELERRFHTNPRHTNSNADFKIIPGSPVAYWVSSGVRRVFDNPQLGSVAELRAGITTGDNDQFVRYWGEVAQATFAAGMESADELWSLPILRWVPLKSGGDIRRWWGNLEKVIRYDESAYHQLKAQGNHCASEDCYFQASITWSDIGSNAQFGVRICDKGFVFTTVGHSLFADEGLQPSIAAFLCSSVANHLIQLINPTLHANPGDVARLPFAGCDEVATANVSVLVASAAKDWDAYERSWDFHSLPILTASAEPAPTLESSYTAWIAKNRNTIAEMKRLEEENNRLFIDAYGLGEELTPDVPIEQITLTVNTAYRYGGKLTVDEQWTRFRQDTMQEFVSYAIGCMMGRYSLDEPGLIYAHSGNEGFDPSRYATFPADADGIVPLTDTEWFDDDAAHRLVVFISVAWDKVHLEENLSFLTENLKPKKNETSRETLRRYLCDKFFKDHLQTYKKRPIYWLFSSGKQKAFQCLVYLHRYNEGTLARMRMEYVVPLQSRFNARIDQLDGDIASASSTANRNRLQKEKDKLVKQREELSRFDEKLRHYADQRIRLELDDGVKVNYGKFGDLLAEVRVVTGKNPKS